MSTPDSSPTITTLEFIVRILRPVALFSTRPLSLYVPARLHKLYFLF